MLGEGWRAERFESDAQLDIVLADDLLYGATSPPREFTKAKFAVKPKFFALPVAAALTILCAAAFAGGSLATKHSSATNRLSQQARQMRGVAPEQDTKAQVASELSGHYYALVIGINNYQHLPKLGTPCRMRRGSLRFFASSTDFKRHLC